MCATESPAAKGRAAKGVRGELQKLKVIRRYNGKDNSTKYRDYNIYGNDIIQKQKEQGWGAKVIEQLSVDLQKRYGSDNGYSARSLGYMKSFAAEYPDFPFFASATCKITGKAIFASTTCKFYRFSRWRVCASAACTNHLVSSYLNAPQDKRLGFACFLYDRGAHPRLES